MILNMLQNKSFWKRLYCFRRSFLTHASWKRTVYRYQPFQLTNVDPVLHVRLPFMQCSWVASRQKNSLGIRSVWSESSLCAHWVVKDPRFLKAYSEVSDQTGRMPRLIWGFAGRKGLFVGFCRSAVHLMMDNETLSMMRLFFKRIKSHL